MLYGVLAKEYSSLTVQIQCHIGGPHISCLNILLKQGLKSEFYN